MIETKWRPSIYHLLGQLKGHIGWPHCFCQVRILGEWSTVFRALCWDDWSKMKTLHGLSWIAYWFFHLFLLRLEPWKDD
jgi:hypothetical protein